MEVPKPPARQEELQQRIDEAWADGGVQPPAMKPGEVRKRLVIQRLCFGLSWMLLLPVFIWLLWPWVEEAIGSGPESRGAEAAAIAREIDEVRSALVELRDGQKGGGEAEAQLQARIRKLERKLALCLGRPEDVEMRVAVGVIGMAIWIVMIGVAIRSRLERPAQKS